MSRSTTAARSLTTAATLFAGPGRASNSTPSVNDSAAFRFIVDDTIQTLSTQNAPNSGPIQGLLFVPSLDSRDSCNNITSPYIPSNVTRLQDVAAFGYHTIGLAPWVTPNCSQAFLNASQRAGTEALVFFLPSSNDTKPPPADDSTWLVGDGDAWKSANQYPVYAIPGPAGATLMEQLSWYSGNGTYPGDQKNNSMVSSKDEEWDIRLFSIIDLESSGKKTPSLWGFILAILGTVVVLCIILLLVYQLIQKRRRENIQRRIEAGETDFEQFGLSNIKVPQEFLATLPIYVYPDLGDVSRESLQQQESPNNNPSGLSEDRAPGESDQARTEKEIETTGGIQAMERSSLRREEREIVHQEAEQDTKSPVIIVDNLPSPSCPSASTLPATRSDSQHPYPKHENRLSRSQTTCAICLDDFVPASSTVRELPCGHIYHPDCIDTSLTQNSSLCPLCKKSVLPAGHYPLPMTNIVYRRHSARMSY